MSLTERRLRAPAPSPDNEGARALRRGPLKQALG